MYVSHGLILVYVEIQTHREERKQRKQEEHDQRNGKGQSESKDRGQDGESSMGGQ